MQKFRIYFFFFLSVFILSCEKHIPKKSLLALGDNYTVGEGSLENQSWPNQLKDSLANFNIFISRPTIVAKSGWTTNELKIGIDNASLNYPYDWVSILIGFNNHYKGGNIIDFKEQFEIILSEAIAFSGNIKENVLVISIPDWGITPFAQGRNRKKIEKEIDNFNQIIYEICALNEIEFVDITQISRKVSSKPDWVAEDGLHPSEKQYSFWIQKMLPFFLKKF